jgi:hypothetical protein
MRQLDELMPDLKAARQLDKIEDFIKEHEADPRLP